jgi:hypothetical protein
MFHFIKDDLSKKLKIENKVSLNQLQFPDWYQKGLYHSQQQVRRRIYPYQVVGLEPQKSYSSWDIPF